MTAFSPVWLILNETNLLQNTKTMESTVYRQIITRKQPNVNNEGLVKDGLYLRSPYGQKITNAHFTEMVGHPSLWVHLCIDEN